MAKEKNTYLVRFQQLSWFRVFFVLNYLSIANFSNELATLVILQRPKIKSCIFTITNIFRQIM